MSANHTITAIEGIRVGHWTDEEAQTGCTVLLGPEDGMVASASYMGPAPGTREGVLLAPEKKVPRIHGLLLSGGSAFGLAAATGVVRYLEEQGIGHQTPFAKVPLVPGAVIYDLVVGDPAIRPNEENGYAACMAASKSPVPTGRVGAGTGATAGKYKAPVPTGLGSALASYRQFGVGALAVVNPVGDIYDLAGNLVAGHGDREAYLEASLGFGNTTLVAVAVDAPLTKCECRLLADSAQAAIARVIRPSHSPWDGDSCFVLSTGTGEKAPLPTLSALVQEAVIEAILGSCS